MQRYANASGDSGVVAFALHADAIDVQFEDGGVYRYSHRKPGAGHVRAMKRLALEGRGLASYINREVRAEYEKKLR